MCEKGQESFMCDKVRTHIAIDSGDRLPSVPGASLVRVEMVVRA